jgi:hypothetical protein
VQGGRPPPSAAIHSARIDPRRHRRRHALRRPEEVQRRCWASRWFLPLSAGTRCWPPVSSRCGGGEGPWWAAVALVCAHPCTAAAARSHTLASPNVDHGHMHRICGIVAASPSRAEASAEAAPRPRGAGPARGASEPFFWRCNSGSRAKLGIGARSQEPAARSHLRAAAMSLHVTEQNANAKCKMQNANTNPPDNSYCTATVPLRHGGAGARSHYCRAPAGYASHHKHTHTHTHTHTHHTVRRPPAPANQRPHAAPRPPCSTATALLTRLPPTLAAILKPPTIASSPAHSHHGLQGVQLRQLFAYVALSLRLVSSAPRCSALLCSALLCSALLSSAMQSSALPGSALHHIASHHAASLLHPPPTIRTAVTPSPCPLRAGLPG